MVPSSFLEENAVLERPPGQGYEDVAVLSVCLTNTEDGTPTVVSCWKLTAGELTEISRTGRVWLMVMGHLMPPVSLTGFKPFAGQG